MSHVGPGHLFDYASDAVARGRKQTFCRVCFRHVSECGPLSARKKCATCGDVLMLVNNRDLQRHHGPMFDHWRRRSLAALGIAVDEPDDQPTAPIG